MDVKKLLVQYASSHAQRTAVIFENQRITFSQLKDNAFTVANYLLTRGIKKGDRVALFLSSTPEALCSFLATFSIGGALIPLDFMLTENEITHFINHSQASILVTQPKKDINLATIKANCPSLKEIIICKGTGENFTSWETIFAKPQTQTPAVAVNEDDLSSIFYTSGSTGQPKGVMLSYKHLDNPVDTINHFLGVSDKDIFLTGGIPFSHLGGLDYILLMMRFASTLVLMERFHPLQFLKDIEQHKVTIFCIVPSMYIAIVSLKEYEKFNLSSLRYAAVFGAPSSAALLQRFHQVCPKATVLNGWGMTETSAPNTYSPSDETKIGSIGKFGFRMTHKIVDDDGNQVAGDQKGELWVKGDGVMTGYYKAPDLTKEVLTADGWLKTGDIAYCDGEGLIYLAGRKKDMIKVAGEIVFSSEVEEKMQRHPKIKEVAVIGVPDAMRGEVPKAFIVAKENEIIDTQELKDFLKENLAHFKIPHQFEMVADLPKNRVGKIDKTKLITK
ncbi:MAG: class I adenylate-forming enzyme family protein [Candidatus Omnitrophica bacterium]|nr:class I adenylate-forming enzyme family protein [Candidatus Omnitrophota bacterium]